jgi:predicted MFS family arabinose efflux permease
VANFPTEPPPRRPPRHPRTHLQSTTTPFARLGFAHAIGVMADAFLTVALAGSLFFTVDPGQARPRVLQYLLLTMVPFVVLSPVIGPLMDRTRGGKRLVIVGSQIGRGLLCLLMARHLHSLLLYPEAFGALILQKGYSVAKSAIVPSLVEGDVELVRSNSRLAMIGAAGAAVGGAPAAGILALTSGKWVLVAGAMVYFTASAFAITIPRPSDVGTPETAVERVELQAPSVIAAGTVMGLLRGAVGYTTFLLAFVLKNQGAPAWFYGAVLVGSGVGNAVGVLITPVLRRRIREEWIIVGSLLGPAIVLLFAARSATRPALVLSAFAIGMGAASARIAFDSLLQRDAPDAIRGRVFARYETRFQLAWVAGGVLAVVVFIVTARAGLFSMCLLLGFGGLFYLGVVERQRHPPPAET